MSEDKGKTCLICFKTFDSVKLRNKHLIKEHKISFQEYIIKFYYNGKHPVCKCGCGTKLAFKPLANGPWFKEYTKNHWPHKKHTNETINKIKINTKKAMQDKYGVSNVYLLKVVKNKIKQTKLEKYGNENYNNPNKMKQTKLKRYGDGNYNNIEKSKQTNLNKYGEEFILSCPEIHKKSKQTKLKKYGDKNYNNIDKVAETKLNKYGYYTEFIDTEFRKKYNGKNSKIEKFIADKLNAEHKFIYKGKEFDIKLNNNIIEIDGDFWHPNKIENLTLIQLNNILNDVSKKKIIEESNYDLIRIHTSKLPKEITLNNLKNNSYDPDYNVNYYQVIMSKDYFKDYIEKRGKNKLEKYIPLLLKFVRTFQQDFPYPPEKENLNDIITKIRNYDLANVMQNNIFRNNCSIVGVNYLKSHHKSYWKSNYKGNKSPEEAWNDDKIMKSIIKYRIGVNNSNEIFDFTIHQLISGLSAMRHTISFFKPILAASIYKHFLGDINEPTVIDPCAGFGGRMLGFKSIYPNGKYIGIEPNKETYIELKELSKNFTNIELYNCKLEDYAGIKKCDLTFTSIPYFDVETYSNNTKYNSFNDWKNIFINALQTFENKKICMSEDILNKLSFNYEYKILNNTSHFNKVNKSKYEVITSMKI